MLWTPNFDNNRPLKHSQAQSVRSRFKNKKIFSSEGIDKRRRVNFVLGSACQILHVSMITFLFPLILSIYVVFFSIYELLFFTSLFYYGVRWTVNFLVS